VGVGLLAASALLHGQTDRSLARIAGTVSASDTGRPIADALVELRPEEIDTNRSISTRTDRTGAFEFREVAPGRAWVIVASAARYLTLGFGQRHPDARPAPLTLRPGQDVNASIVLPRLGAVSGRVIDPFGDPLPGVGVYLFTEAEVQGSRRLVTGGRSLDPRPTDDLGQFRVWGLPPGVYYLGVLSGALNASPRFNMTNEMGGFVPTYFPGTTSIDEAQRIRLGIGEQLNDLTVAAVPGRMFRVSGKVMDSKGQPLASALMSIAPAAATMSPAIAGRTQAAADGSFTFSNVPAGSYVVQARSLGTVDAFTGEFGWTSVTVGSSDLSEQVVSTAGPASLGGRLQFVDGRPTLREQFSLRITAPSADLATEPVIPIATRDPGHSIDGDGNFGLDRLWGRRLIRVASSTEWILEKVSIGGRDVTDTPIDFNGRQITGVELFLTKRSASLSGRVTNDRGEGIEGRVVVFPADSDLWTANSRFVGSALAGRDGTFTVYGLPPGDYLAVALPQRVVAPTARAFLPDIRARATSIVLPEGFTRDVALTLILP
jgi:hypothetical protein